MAERRRGTERASASHSSFLHSTSDKKSLKTGKQGCQGKETMKDVPCSGFQKLLVPLELTRGGNEV